MALVIPVEDTRPFCGSTNLNEVKLNHRRISDLNSRISGFSPFSLMFGGKPNYFMGQCVSFVSIDG